MTEYEILHIDKENATSLFILFHGTGGNEHDLVSIASYLSDTSSILSLRGNINENGHLRFFKRINLQQIDVDDLSYRAQEVIDFLNRKIKELNYEHLDKISFGYSNGANLITAINQHAPNFFDYNIIAHGTKYLNLPLNDQSKSQVFISLGRNDSIIHPNETRALAKEYEAQQAQVTLFQHDRGHSLDREEVFAMKEWLDKKTNERE